MRCKTDPIVHLPDASIWLSDYIIFARFGRLVTQFVLSVLLLELSTNGTSPALGWAAFFGQ